MFTSHTSFNHKENLGKQRFLEVCALSYRLAKVKNERRMKDLKGGPSTVHSSKRADISHKENLGKQMTSEPAGTSGGPKGGNFNSLSRQRFAAGVGNPNVFYFHTVNINSQRALDSYRLDLGD